MNLPDLKKNSFKSKIMSYFHFCYFTADIHK